MPLDTPEWSNPTLRDANHHLVRTLADAPKIVQPILVNAVKDGRPSMDENGRLIIELPLGAITNALIEAHRARVRDIFVAVTIVVGSCAFVAGFLYLLR